MPLLTAADYPAVRAALDTSLTTAELPDAVLDLPVYAPAAIRDVLARDPIAETRTDPDQVARIKNAAIYYLAARVAGRLPTVESEQFGDYRYNLAKRDWERTAAEMRALAEAELAAVLAPTAPRTAARPTMFAVAPGRRGV